MIHWLDQTGHFGWEKQGSNLFVSFFNFDSFTFGLVFFLLFKIKDPLHFLMFNTVHPTRGEQFRKANEKVADSRVNQVACRCHLGPDN